MEVTLDKIDEKEPWLKIFGVAFVGVTLFFTGCWFVDYMKPLWKTEKILENEIFHAKLNDKEEGSLNIIDGWDSDIIYTRQADKKAVLYHLISPGRDKEMGTKDDMKITAVDWNKSRIIGDYVGRKAKQAVIGVKEGWSKKSKFDIGEDE